MTEEFVKDILELKRQEFEKQDMLSKNNYSPPIYEVISKKYHSSLSNIIEVFDEVFGREYWDMQVEPRAYHNLGGNSVYNKELNVVVRFPELTVTNENERSILLENFFLRLVFNGRRTYNLETSDYTYFFDMRANLEGKLNTPSAQQLYKDYHHSHIHSSADRINFQSFCTGRNFFSDLYRGYNNDPCKENLFMLAKYMINMASTESLAGVPYIKMDTVLFTDHSRTLDESVFHNLNQYVKYLKIKPVDWTFKNGFLSIVDNEKFERNLYELVMNSIDELNMEETNTTWLINNIKCRKDNLGNYYSIRQDFDNDYIQTYIRDQNTNNTFYFKGSKFPISLSKETFINEDNFYLNQKIKKHAKQYIERQINEKKLTSYFKSRSNRSKIEQDNNVKNKILVQ